MPKSEEKVKPSQEELQELMIQYELLKREVTNIDAQIRELQLKHNELEMVKQGIKAIKGQSQNEILVPAGAGLYVKSKLVDGKNCLVNVGANVIMKKTITEAVKLINKQIDNAMNVIIKLNEAAEQLINRMIEIEPQIMMR